MEGVVLDRKSLRGGAFRHQVNPYVWRIFAECATHKDILGGAFLQNAPPLRLYYFLVELIILLNIMRLALSLLNIM